MTWQSGKIHILETLSNLLLPLLIQLGDNSILALTLIV